MNQTTASLSAFMSKFIFPALIVPSILIGASHTTAAAPKTCESLAQLVLPNSKITAAQPVTTGEFTPPGRAASLKDLPPSVAWLLPSRLRLIPTSRLKSGFR